MLCTEFPQVMGPFIRVAYKNCFNCPTINTILIVLINCWLWIKNVDVYLHFKNTQEIYYVFLLLYRNVLSSVVIFTLMVDT